MNEDIRILHVDDEPKLADLVGDFLEREDSDLVVEGANTVGEALDRFENGSFDCVISDYDMPDLNGIEFLEAIRETDSTVPFILFTGKGSEEIASDAISAGVTDYLQKEIGTEQYAVLANRVRNAVEQARAERERRRHLEAIETTQEGISILDEDGHFVYVNQAYADLYGYAPEGMVGEHWELLYPEEDVQAIYEDVIPKVEGTGYWQGRTTGKRADGSTFIEDHRLALTEHGELVCTVRDISDKTDRDRKLDRMDAMLSTLFETLPVGVLAEDESRNVLASNDRLMDLFDVDGSPTDLVGENCDRLATTVCHLFADPDAFVDRIDELVARREPVRGEELRLNDGRTFSRSYEPVSFSDGKGHLWVYRDVTEQKERERQLEERTDQLESLTVRLEEQYRYLFEEAPVMAVVTRAEAGEPIIEDCNHLFAETLGYDKEDLIDRKLARYYTDESRRSLLDEGDYERALSGRLMREERVLVSESGEHVDTLLRAVPRYDLTDDVVGTLAFFVDVTERRELEQERDRLEDFSDIVSHDLRNPLNVAQGSLEAARHECTCDSGNEHLAAIEEAHDRIQTLIEELLLLARSGDHVDEPEPIDVQSLVRSCWQTVETADATAVVEIDRRVMADRGRLRQLFENLVRNAVEHGGDDVTVTVGTLDDGFFVEDDGAGIPPEYHERVFEAGFSGAESGTGIGLSIVDEIAQAHDWSVHVTDAKNGGARFELRGVTFERS